MYEIEGTVKMVLPEQTFASGFKKQEFILTSDDRYPQDLKFEATQERVELAAKLKEQDRVKVTFALRGAEWKGKYFVNLQAYKVDALEGGGAADGDGPPDSYYDNVDTSSNDDDVPF